MVLYGAYSFHIKSKDCMLACTIDLQNSAVEPTRCTGDSKESPFRGTWLAHKRVGVICHGLLSHKGSRTIIALSQYILEHIPYIDAIVRFDFHGNGESTGYDKWSYGGYVEEVEDLRNVVQFLVRSNASVPLLLGHSRAATVVVLYGCVYSDVPRIVSLAGRVNMSQQSSLLFSPEQEALLKQGHSVTFTDKDGHSRTVTPACLQQRQKVDVEEAFQRLRLTQWDGSNVWTQLLILHCENDTIVPVEDAYTLYSIASGSDTIAKVELQVLDTGGHAFVGTEPEARLPDILTSLFKENGHLPE